MERGAGKIAIVYLAAGICWILFSDMVFSGAPVFIQSAKGVAYVVLTAIGLWYFLGKAERRNRKVLQNLISVVDALKVKDEHLQQEKILLRTVIDILPDNIFVKDRTGKIMMANTALVKFVGKTTESEIMGGYVADFFPEHVSLLAAQNDEDLVSGKSTLSEHEFLLRDKSGKMLRILSIKAPVFDSNGEVVNVIGLSRDITAVYNKTQTDELVLKIIHALSDNDNLKTALVATLKLIGDHFDFKFAEAWLATPSQTEVDIAATWSSNADSSFHHNHRTKYHAGEGLPGLTLSSKEIQIWTNIMNHDDFLRKEIAMNEDLNTGIGIPMIQQDNVVAVFTFLSHETFYDFTHVKMVLMQVAAQIVLHLERKKHEQELEASSERINDILESISDGFYATDEKWTVTYWNNTAEQLLKKQREHIVGFRLWDQYPGLLGTPFEEYYNKAMYEKVTTSFVYYYEPLNAWFDITAYPSKNGISVVFRDLSELRRLNSELDQRIKELNVSNAELEHFAYIASHDLQEPLRMVTGFMTQLQKKYENQLDDKAQQYINFAVDGAVRMRKIILDLLEYSRVGKLEMQLEAIDTNELIEGILKMNHTLFEEQKVTLSYAQLPNIFGVRTLLQQVFHNLIINAVKYRKPDIDPVITISGTEGEGFWTFAVTDNGIGIKSDFYDKVFVIFQRLHNREEYSGTGIGLAICKKIIENHGGRIWIDSQEGIGSTFYFTIKK